MVRRPIPLMVLVLPSLLIPTYAQAYIGPGIGVGALAAVLGVLAAIFVALFALLYYPIKRLLRRRRGNAAGSAEPGQ
jgi:hypothetical protein